MKYDFILHKLARIISKVISEDKNLVFMVVDDDELEKYPEFRDWNYIAELHGNKRLLESVKTEHAPLVTLPAQSTGTLF